MIKKMTSKQRHELCDEIKEHIDEAMTALGNRLTELDRRDAHQWEIGSAEIKKIPAIEKELDLVNTKVNEMKTQLAVSSNELNKSLESIHTKLDKAQNTIDNVQANGRKGLNEAFQDLYTEVKAVKDSQSHNLTNSWVWKFLTSGKWASRLIIMSIVYLVVATIFHLMGVNVDLLHIFSTVAK